MYFIKLRPGIPFPAGVRDSSAFKSVRSGSGTQPASYSLSVVVLSKGVKRLGREFDHSTPPTAVVKNKHSQTSTSLIRLHAEDRYNFTFSPTIFGDPES